MKIETREVQPPRLELRDVPPRVAYALEQAGVHPLLARLYAARGVLAFDELDEGLARLLPPAGLKGTQEAAVLLADAIVQQRRICIVADYDCDGATACAVAMRGLAMLGAAPGSLSYVVPDRTVHGFDSFVGLPTAWGGKAAGAFDVGGKPPELPVDNVEFHIGWFDDTVPVFAREHSGPFALAHLDADLYSSTKTVFDHLGDWFVPGTVVIFDEYFGFHGWQHHEHKAFVEFLERTGLSFEAISLGHMNLAVRLVEG